MGFLDEVEKKLDLPPGEKAQVMRELESHWRETEEELIASGMNECEAASEAARRLGDPQDVASRLQTVHCQATRKAALLTVLPFLGLVLTVLSPTLTGVQAKPTSPIAIDAFGIAVAVFAVTMMAGSIRELKAGRRPVWLTTWLAVGVTMLAYTIRLSVYRAFGLAIGAEDSGSEHMIRQGSHFLVMGPLALWASRGSRKWTGIVVGALALAIGLTIRTLWIPVDQQLFFAVLYVMALPSLLLMLVSLRLFVFHPYGTVYQASLCLFAAHAYRVANVDTAPVVALVQILLAGIVAWATVRACTHQHKLSVLTAGVYLVAVGGSLVEGWVSPPAMHVIPPIIDSIITGVGMGLFYQIWIVQIPEWLGGGPSTRPPRTGLIIQR